MKSSKEAYVQEPIAVIGLACRLPGCNSPEALWNFLERGGVANNEVPESRFNLKGHYDGSRKPKTMRSPGGMFLETIDPADFDAQFFGTTRQEAIAMDPQQRQLLEVVYECLENAGIGLETLVGKQVGCFVGSFAVDYADIHTRDPEDRPPSVTGGVGRAILSNRISHYLDIRGPSFTIDTGCSGSLVAVDVACRYLNSGEISSAIVAASNLYMSPEHVMDEGAMKGAASGTGKCHTFDAKADGYIKAEGVNAVVLKRLDDAIRDGDPIRAVIRGSATNSDGRTPGIASPSAEAQASAIRAAYANAGLDVHDTNYVECHGTGTPAGDPIEVSALSSVFRESRSPDRPMLIGSIKSNIGHSEPAAGISGLIKAILSIEKGFIPGNPTFITPNPNIDFERLRVRVSRTTVPWPAVPFRRVSVNCFGYGGSNAHLILDDAKTFPKRALRAHVSSYTSDFEELFADEEETQPFTLVFSANDEQSLREYCKAICKHLVNPSVVVRLPDLAYTLSERRSRLFHRAYVVTKKVNLDEGAFTFGKKGSDAPKIGFIFTGQGAQWPQMGKGIIENFPVAKSLIKHLDHVLQSLPNAPSWTLIDELVKQRSPDRLRVPEFSQPLTTALQLAILAVFDTWGIFPTAVVGHSSGEIAAAFSAGLLTAEEAIKVAFLRGQACSSDQPKQPLGMLAVGLGSDSVQPYIGGMGEMVQVGCFNSPRSITLSGSRQALEEIKSRLDKDGHFARMLQVDFAYHSMFMEDSAAAYEDMILLNCGLPLRGKKDVTMFSSVTGKRLSQACDATYWTKNMTSPVLFDEAVRGLVSDGSGANFLVEIGPSGALSGPLKQIQKALGDTGSSIQYCAALSRGKYAIKSLFDVAGRLFVSGGVVDMSKVNEIQVPDKSTPAVIVDLPNYVWNHSTKYWHESEASKDYRFRKFPHHDLLGSKILGTSWNAPSWKKILKVENLHWLKDHRMGQDIVFPAAGYMAMGVEALYQARQSLDPIDESSLFERYRYRLRDMTFSKALVLQEKGEGHKIITTLAQRPGTDSWHEFRISSLTVGDTWVEHSRGSICLEEDPGRVAPKSSLAPLIHPTSGKSWYKSMHEAGYSFGPLFQTTLEVESLSGKRSSRSIVSLEKPTEEYQQSYYPMHPVAIDGCLQTVVPSLWKGNRSSVDAVLIPAIIDSIIIKPTALQVKLGLSLSSSQYVGVGRQEKTKNYMSDASVHDHDTGALLFQVSGLRYHQLDVSLHQHASHRYSQICWKPDVAFLTREKILSLPIGRPHGNSSLDDTWQTRVTQLLDLIAHKKPNLKVLEVNTTPGDFTSVWLEGNFDKEAYFEYCLGTPNATTLMSAQDKYNANGGTKFSVLDLTRIPEDSSLGAADFDLVIVKMTTLANARYPIEEVDFPDDIVLNGSQTSSSEGLIASSSPTEHPTTEDEESSYDSGVNLGEKRKLNATPRNVKKLRRDPEATFSNVVQNVRARLRDGGYLLYIQENSSYSNLIHENVPDTTDDSLLAGAMRADGFVAKIHVPCGEVSIHLAEAISKDTSSLESAHQVNLVHLTDPTDIVLRSKEALSRLGWQIVEHFAPFSKLGAGAILVLDELTSPILTTINNDQWKTVQELTSRGNKILWVTTGSQFDVTKPDNSLIHGLARTIRAEDPLLTFMTLDTESNSGTETTTAIDQTLRYLEKASSNMPIESELVERGGILNISRIRPDQETNKAERDEKIGAETQIKNLHESKTLIRLQCERLGTLDSLHYAEVSYRELPLADHLVEVEIFAAGLNFKDLAVTMGIVPQDEHRPGLEGAGVVRRVGSLVSSFQVGQRVLVYDKGCFANRTQATPERVCRIPASISFEDAATLSSVYLVTIYGLSRLAKLQKNQSVLIHSASGGVGIAAIQLCQYIGAKIFATVGTDKKRDFLASTFGIPPEHILSSRSTLFAAQIRQLTDGKGVDVILNSLTGDLLDASWRCIADGGTMIEIGKKDVLARNHISMEPFNRNATYRGLDMSHESITDPIIASLLLELMDLVEKGHVKPISPMTIFAFEDIVDAFRFLRAGTHIGKVVISNGINSQVEIPVRPAPRTLLLNPGGSYFIVGGLRGLCGSLAVFLARMGAKHLVIFCRSGYKDDKSQAVLANIAAEGCQVDLFQGDVSNAEDVNRAFSGASYPIKGVIHGAMVLRDKIYISMTAREFHEAITCKVKGTWNLHNASLALPTPLDFFTLLSSISGVIGQKGQANYAAANVFLDGFASYRRSLSLPACSIDLGVVEDVGYVAENADSLQTAFDREIWTPINESLLHQILRFSILQQTNTSTSSCQMITGIAIPQPASSPLLKRDPRFRGLHFPSSTNSLSGNLSAFANDNEEAKAIRAFLLSVCSSSSQQPSLLTSLVSILSTQFSSSLRLVAPMEPAKPLSSYGLDSLSAVEFRNWCRMELGADLTTLDIMGASSLFSLAGRILGKIKEKEKEMEEN